MRAQQEDLAAQRNEWYSRRRVHEICAEGDRCGVRGKGAETGGRIAIIKATTTKEMVDDGRI